MYYVIPITNFVTDYVLKLKDSFIIPNMYFKQYIDNEIHYDGAITESEKILIHNVMEICIKDYHKFMSVSCIIMKNIDTNIINNSDVYMDMFHLEKMCYKANRYLDFFRIHECTHLNKDILPGLPGQIEKSITKEVIAVNEKTDEYRSLLGNVIHLYTQHGLGLYTDMASPNLEHPKEYEYFFSSRNDEVYLNCRAALSRISDSMYIDDLSISFIYLMSTLEMLASREYVNFRKVKSRILPFICDTKENYHKLSEELRVWSESYRTNIIHNGKSILDLVSSEGELKRIFSLLCSYINNYCSTVLDTGITTFIELESYRLEKKSDLGIK
ncbi:MAG: hypothetical protein VB100_10675 [Angelakisella sp.]|nr:hypothetical protein [Angelakisella sp.]